MATRNKTAPAPIPQKPDTDKILVNKDAIRSVLRFFIISKKGDEVMTDLAQELKRTFSFTEGIQEAQENGLDCLIRQMRSHLEYVNETHVSLVAACGQQMNHAAIAEEVRGLIAQMQKRSDEQERDSTETYADDSSLNEEAFQRVLADIEIPETKRPTFH